MLLLIFLTLPLKPDFISFTNIQCHGNGDYKGDKMFSKPEVLITPHIQATRHTTKLQLSTFLALPHSNTLWKTQHEDFLIPTTTHRESSPVAPVTQNQLNPQRQTPISSKPNPTTQHHCLSSSILILILLSSLSSCFPRPNPCLDDPEHTIPPSNLLQTGTLIPRNVTGFPK